VSALPGRAETAGRERHHHGLPQDSLGTDRPPERTQTVRYARLALRFASGVVLVPFLLGVAYFGDRLPVNGISVVYGVLITAACGYAAYELHGMLRGSGFAPQPAVLFGVALLLPLDAWLRGDRTNVAPDGLAIMLVLAIGSLMWLLRAPSDNALASWALSLALALYVGGLMQFYMPLRRVPAETPGFWVMSLLGVSWICDSCAYFVGGAWGRTRLAPAVSPKKSVEGAVAGVVGAAIFGMLLSLPTGLPPLLLAGYGLAIGLATVVGDLIESLVKRQLGAKDSGVLIPGHGGLLDRMDSLLLCAPVAVAYLAVFAA
jgi:phosphatidate cytidylyltransferase